MADSLLVVDGNGVAIRCYKKQKHDAPDLEEATVVANSMKVALQSMPKALMTDAARLQQIEADLANVDREGSEMAQREATSSEIADVNVRRHRLQTERNRISWRLAHPDAAK